MYGGAPTIYVDYTGYDAIAHHCGPERVEAIDALAGIDRAIGSLLKAARYSGRPYRMVVLSDHGQCLSATFQQRCGQSLEAVIAEQLPDTLTIVGTTGAVESAGSGRRIAAEFGRGSGLGPLVARRLPGGPGRPRGGSGSDAVRALPDVVVASSGNLAHVYFTSEPGQMVSEAIEKQHPGLIEALARILARTNIRAVRQVDLLSEFGFQQDISPVPGEAIADHQHPDFITVGEILIVLMNSRIVSGMHAPLHV